MLDKFTVLKEYFGHASFRHGQEKVVDAILQGRDALCVMPTGAGKSVCYQVPAMLFSGITLVISPLISLMKDQVNALTQNGIRAAYLNSSLTPMQYARAMENIRNGMYRIVYIAPERLEVPEFLEACRALTIDLVAVDEAHCVSQWGQDFRPSYLRIAEFVAALGYRPTIAAFTATATAEVKEDIERALGLISPLRITTGFDRPNLRFEVLHPAKKIDALLGILDRHEGDVGIVYCSTRKTVEEVTATLVERGVSATMYHAGLADNVRRQNQEDFVFDRRSVMVATNAFGMGIDKSNVSFVVHYNMPMDIESYYQEAGRAGRDGAAAECILLYSGADVYTNRFLIQRSEPNPDLTEEEQILLRERDHERLKQMTFYSTTRDCLRAFILDYFGEAAPPTCGNCSSCCAERYDTDVTDDARAVLACIVTTGERYGRRMISDILRGSRAEKILSLSLDTHPTYGTLRRRSEAGLRELLEELERADYIESTGGDYPTLSITPRGEDVLSGAAHVILKLQKPQEPIKKSKKKQKAEAAAAVSRPLLEELRSLRRTLADAKGVPAYVIFSDATLIDMCKKHPKTLEEMLAVSGVGRVKLEQYGAAFLAVLTARGE